MTNRTITQKLLRWSNGITTENEAEFVALSHEYSRFLARAVVRGDTGDTTAELMAGLAASMGKLMEFIREHNYPAYLLQGGPLYRGWFTLMARVLPEPREEAGEMVYILNKMAAVTDDQVHNMVGINTPTFH